MAKFEIINPSDQCFIQSEDRCAAAMATVLISTGKYGLDEIGSDWNMPILAFGGDGAADAWFQKEFGVTVESYLKDNHEAELIAVLETFKYAGQPTSANNIAARVRSAITLLQHRIDRLKVGA